IFCCMDRPRFVYSSTDGHLGYFHLLTTGSSAAINMGVQISVQAPAFNSSGYIPRSKELLDHIFHFLRNPQTVS
uniref:Uncharacterized protein n=1 Tax=Rhinolophus ferrumequinum TaxID=59479 RepID=A0A671FFD5_RHIFE